MDYTVQWKAKGDTHWETDRRFESLEEAILFATAEARYCHEIAHRVTGLKSNGLPKVLVKFKPLGGE